MRQMNGGCSINLCTYLAWAGWGRPPGQERAGERQQSDDQGRAAAGAGDQHPAELQPKDRPGVQAHEPHGELPARP